MSISPSRLKSPILAKGSGFRPPALSGCPAGRFPGREGSSMPLLRFPLTCARCLPSAQAGEVHLPPWLSGLRVSPCHHLQNGCCPVSQAGVPLVPVRHREGLSPVTWAQLPAPAYQATKGT